MALLNLTKDLCFSQDICFTLFFCGGLLEFAKKKIYLNNENLTFFLFVSGLETSYMS